jgi:hypothetical protein
MVNYAQQAYPFYGIGWLARDFYGFGWLDSMFLL